VTHSTRSGTKRSFAPVANADTRVLVLGSLPGEVSLARGQYYANPRNQFWRIMEPVIDARLIDVAYDVRLAALLSAGVGLWDVIGSASRTGSLDSDIRQPRPNPLRDLVGKLPLLQAVAFNGGKASDLGWRQLDESGGLELLSLPSTSPANTAPLDRKQVEWNRIRRFLEQPHRSRAGQESRAR
jgi:hypoxanthine-DNA glycosylase